MKGLMTVPMIAAVALAMLAAVLAIFAWRQRQELARLQDAGAPCASRGAGGDTMLAMLAALREPALLHGERIEAVNDAFSTLSAFRPPSSPARRLLSSSRRICRARRTRRHARARRRVESRTHGGGSLGFAWQVTRLELTGSAIDYAGRKLVLFTAEEMLPQHEGEGAGLPPARSQLALDSLGEGLLTTDAHGLIDYLNPSAETLTGIRRETRRPGVRRDDRLRGRA
jgi:PAS domain-containing protein